MSDDQRRPRHGKSGPGPRSGPGRSNRPPSRPDWRARRAAEIEDGVVLYGWHPVAEALANPRRVIRRLLVTENALRRLTEELGVPRISPELVRPDEIARKLDPDAVHQGLYIEADPLPSPTIETMNAQSLILVLDQITDPHNVGAIVRTAAAFGVDAIVTTARHSPSATGVMAKSASGGLEHVPFTIVRNLAGALQTLRERGFLCIGLDSAGGTELESVPLRRPVALVLGAEGKGLRQLTRERCSVLARLDMPGSIKSLNVSNAAAVALYATSRALAALK
ncbi:23S rRNA (guanosine(2251)-2'-O)-methyltransferase RlmB [Chelatococcus asaccharovorans]|uniref:23S rRNA (Guanosine2251-2'-O)-methyltransferase n=1 Tax=Chelatococcus asaccharovorans TaxID=28210 RepID=A0A2V3U6Y7_9HYPH|nr:23S rRNA (guanosine(2251)-2'-O)-methyltransferase RlmB [Chelatococcus asaccharovorans]MBS7704082.1 23S rRNA (guanosine(2251)-2'-O)-methyltransferase RlmB [Chelatococcus asaccharovorans]PXW58248.1 23S rRNA (guanosine2251-2'-O)-methyltransferase [Chelatococcus asaccharovorans]